MLTNFLLVGAGGALGSILRYSLAVIIGTRPFPYATFTANILGSLLIGMLLGLSLKNSISDYTWKFLSIGVCGGFTTFSAYSLENFQYLQQGRFGYLIVYIGSSISLGLLATYVGYIIVKN